MAAFKIIEPTVAKSSNRASLPELGEHGECQHPATIPVDFGPENGGVRDLAPGAKLDFGDGEIYVLTAPVGWTWQRQRGKVAKSS